MQVEGPIVPQRSGPCTQATNKARKVSQLQLRGLSNFSRPDL